MTFKYLNHSRSDISDMTTIKEILKKHSLIIDQHYLPIIEQAEDGDFESICELAETFANGSNGLKPNYELARRYGDIIMTKMESTDEPIPILEAYVNRAVLEMSFGKEAEAKVYYKKALKFMMEEYDSVHWDGELHEFFFQITKKFYPEEER